MKRTAGAIVMLAGLGGCATPDGGTQTSQTAKPFNTAYSGVAAPNVVGPNGEPVHLTAARGAAPAGKSEKKSAATTDPMVQQAAGFARIGGGSSAGCDTCNVHTPGLFGKHMGGCADGSCGHGGGTYDPYAYGPMGHGIGTMLGRNGIMPVPGMGPAGAVAYVPPPGWGGGAGMPSGQRTSVKFTIPAGAKITWLGPTGYIEPGLIAPASYNFLQGNVYRLRVSGIPNRAGKVYYPTLELANVTAKTMEFLAHNTVPVGLSDDDLERVNGGNFVTKVIYLPDPAFQDLAAIAGAEEIVSTQLNPGEDPKAEANRRGTILAIIRVGNIDLENPYSPTMDATGAPPPSSGPGMMMPGAGGGMMAPPTGPMMTPPVMTPPSSTPGTLPAMPAPTPPATAPMTPAPIPAPKSTTPPPSTPGGPGATGIKAPATLPGVKISTAIGK